jgi:hypothetical protein
LHDKNSVRVEMQNLIFLTENLRNIFSISLF